MNPIFLIPLILILAGVVFMAYMNKKHKSVVGQMDLDFERTKYEEYKQEVLNRDFQQVKNWMQGKSIDALTSGSIPQSTNQRIKEVLSDGAKNMALSAIGVKLKRIDTECFWVLSGNDLHFLSADAIGELQEHLVFDYFRLEEATLEYAGILKASLALYSKSSEEYLPQVHRITFNIDGGALTLEIHDRLYCAVDPADLLDVNKQLRTRAKYQVIGERLIPKLQVKFPNLNII